MTAQKLFKRFHGTRRIVLLDSGPLGLACTRHRSPLLGLVTTEIVYKLNRNVAAVGGLLQCGRRELTSANVPKNSSRRFSSIGCRRMAIFLELES